MPTNQILQFAGGGGANVLTPTQYAALASIVANGFQSGVLPSNQLNVVLRQSAFVSAMIAQFIADKSGQNVNDDGNLATLEANFIAAFSAAGVFTTPAQFDTSTKVATMAALQRALGNAAGLFSFSGGTVGLDASYIGKIINNYGGAATINLPSVAGIAIGAGYLFVNNLGSGAMTINVNGSDTIVGGAPGMVLGAGDTALIYSASPTQWIVAGGSYGAPGRLINVQTLSATGTYTPTPGMRTCIPEVVGGGGGGGGTAATGAGQFSVGGGGGSGAYGKGRFTAAQIGASQAVTIGTGGAGGVGGASGAAGGTSSLGALLSAPGGGGGLSTGPLNYTSSGIAPSGNGGAVATGGSILNTTGVPGTIGVITTSPALNSGSGGGSPMMGGGGGGIAVTGTGNGGNGLAPGAGGAGAGSGSADVAHTGGAGSAGRIVVWEFA